MTVPEIALDSSGLRFFRAWKAEWMLPDAGLWQYLGARGNLEFAAIFAKLFWPDFVEVDGCVLLAEQHEDEHFRHWRARLKGDREGLERLLNHVHMWDLFPHGHGDEHDSLHVAEFLALSLLRVWRYALQEAFPEKRFGFYYATDPEDYGPTISFYQLTVEDGARAAPSGE